MYHTNNLFISNFLKKPISYQDTILCWVWSVKRNVFNSWGWRRWVTVGKRFLTEIRTVAFSDVDYTNDHQKLLAKLTLFYADDTSVVVTHKTRVRSCYPDWNFHLLHHWFFNNGTKLNPDKTQLVNFHPNYRLFHKTIHLIFRLN